MNGWTVLGGTALVWVLYYVGSCWWFPYGKCWCCKGHGTHGRTDGKVFRDCWWCKGRGRRWRLGRVLWNRLHG